MLPKHNLGQLTQSANRLQHGFTTRVLSGNSNMFMRNWPPHGHMSVGPNTIREYLEGERVRMIHEMECKLVKEKEDSEKEKDEIVKEYELQKIKEKQKHEKETQALKDALAREKRARKDLRSKEEEEEFEKNMRHRLAEYGVHLCFA